VYPSQSPLKMTAGVQYRPTHLPLCVQYLQKMGRCRPTHRHLLLLLLLLLIVVVVLLLLLLVVVLVVRMAASHSL
jgi:hypothetical protein